MVAVFPQVRSGKGNDNVCNIINLVKKHSLSEYATMSEMVILVKSEQNAILGNKEINIEEFKKSLNSFDFFNNDNYVNNSNVDLFDYQNLFFKFKNAIVEYLNNKDIKDKKSQYFTLPSSPSLDAFTKVGNNKLDIMPTGRDYGLLFE